MKRVCIKEKEFNPSLLYQGWCSEEMARAKGYTIYDAPDDCAFEDFDSNGFNSSLYNARKNKADIPAQIANLKANLALTDYQAIKFAEGELTAEEFEPIKEQRKAWREEINALEAQL